MLKIKNEHTKCKIPWLKKLNAQKKILGDHILPVRNTFRSFLAVAIVDSNVFFLF